MPSPETSRRNLEKARARWRAPRPWRCDAETQLIKRIVWRWCSDGRPRWSGRQLARLLAVSHTYVRKLAREFARDSVLPGIDIHATFEELGPELAQARMQTRKMRIQCLL